MKELSQSRKTRYTQMALQDSLIELMQKKPISKITIKELCEKADLNRTTFYAHYTDQYDLLRQIEEETLSWGRNMISSFTLESPKADVLRNLEKVFDYLVENRNHIQVLMSEQGDLDFQKQLMTTIYEQCGVSPINKPGADLATRELYFVFVVNGSIGLIQNWLKNGFKESTPEMVEIIYNMTFYIRQESNNKGQASQISM
ncbi:MAG: TetR-like C-terminal domain-containing protein [Oscillospiraceae bacterium]|nr:TetR-like C-terminal domain-containing protein [Oscillospiraceae bacterium]